MIVWTPIRTTPTPGRSYLIAANYGGVETHDVAFYNGKRPDGSHWWTLGDVEIDQKCIIAWAVIEGVNWDFAWQEMRVAIDWALFVLSVNLAPSVVMDRYRHLVAEAY
jgi:hypothetical protein